MASRNAALKALLVATLLSSFLFQGQGVPEDCCYCKCYKDCMHWLKKPLSCKWHCATDGYGDDHCHILSCKGNRCRPSKKAGRVVTPGMFAAGGGGLDKGNVTETGAAAAPSA